MLNWYDWIMLVVAIVIIVLCLLQGGKSEGASGAITGGGLNVFVKTKTKKENLLAEPRKRKNQSKKKSKSLITQNKTKVL